MSDLPSMQSNMSCAVSMLCEAPCAKEGGKANRASPEKKNIFLAYTWKTLAYKNWKGFNFT